MKYALYLNDVLIDYFKTLKDVDFFIDNYIGYIGKIEVKKIKNKRGL